MFSEGVRLLSPGSIRDFELEFPPPEENGRRQFGQLRSRGPQLILQKVQKLLGINKSSKMNAIHTHKLKSQSSY